MIHIGRSLNFIRLLEERRREVCILLRDVKQIVYTNSGSVHVIFYILQSIGCAMVPECSSVKMQNNDV